MRTRKECFKNISTILKNDAILLDKKVGGGYNKLTFIENILFIAFLAKIGDFLLIKWITHLSYPQYRKK